MLFKKMKIVFFIFILLFILILYLIYNNLFYKNKIENFSNKKIYLIWRNLKESMSWGLGDKVRSSIAVFQYCKRKNIELILDGTDDISSKFLKNIKSNEYDYIKDKDVIDIPHTWNFEETVESNLEKNDEIFITTNKCPDNDDCSTYKKNIFSDDEKNFAKYICEPLDFLKIEIDEIIKELPKNYGIQHFRFDDNVFLADIEINNDIFIEFFNILKKNYKETYVLLSNLTNYKNFEKDNLNIKIIKYKSDNQNVSHTGNSHGNDNEYESVKNSFIDFFILTKAKYIKTNSSYGWMSNFVKWPALIYDIDIERYGYDIL